LAWLADGGAGFDVIDGHFFYPDGVAAVMLGKKLGKPVVISARGSDLTYLPRFAYQRRWIQWAMREADALVTVSESLRREAITLGAVEGKVRTLRNGVNLEEFRPVDRAEARRFAGVPETAKVVASVGNLIPLKGHDLFIRALAGLPDVHGLIVGGGPEDAALRTLVDSLGLNDRVHFLGRVPHGTMAKVYSAADGLVLASSREGWPNVLLEAMACGTPAVATAVGGIPEIVTVAESGYLLADRTSDAIAAALSALFQAPPDRAATRAYAEKFDWSETVSGLVDVYRSVLIEHAARS
jgi:glycosyltransferase involved in cell wall biosynthesis